MTLQSPFNLCRATMKFFAFLLLFAVYLSCSRVDSVPQGRIINGQDSDYMPHVVMVSGYNDNYGSFGGGSFISLSHVLTAGSLIHNMAWFFVDYGRETLGGLPYESATGLLHPDYNPETFENDIGILFLANPADSNLVVPIPLPIYSGTPYVNEQGRISGFGMFQRGTDWIMNQRKQKAYYRRIMDSQCDELLAGNNIKVTDNSFCGLDMELGASVCYGDHGSGLVVAVDGVDTLVGVVSVFTNMCHKEFPVVFTRVANYVSWIYETSGVAPPETTTPWPMAEMS